MKEIFYNYNKTLGRIICFRMSDFFGKALSFFMDVILLISLIFLYVLISSKSWEYLWFFSVSFILYYFFIFIVFILIEYPDKVIYREIIELCKHIDTFFGEDFTRYDEYIKKDKVPSFHRKILIDKLPTTEMMFIWKYRLEERKNLNMMMLPFIAAISLVNLEYILKLLDFYNVDLFSYFEKFYGQEVRIVVPMILNLLKYSIISILYLDKMAMVSKTIYKVDLLLAVKK